MIKKILTATAILIVIFVAICKIGSNIIENREVFLGDCCSTFEELGLPQSGYCFDSLYDEKKHLIYYRYRVNFDEKGGYWYLQTKANKWGISCKTTENGIPLDSLRMLYRREIDNWSCFEGHEDYIGRFGIKRSSLQRPYYSFRTDGNKIRLYVKPLKSEENHRTLLIRLGLKQNDNVDIEVEQQRKK